VRLFLALNLPARVRAGLYAATAPMRAAAPALAWATEERFHLTLKFLGDQPEERIAALDRALGAVTPRHAPLVLQVAGLGAFPNLRAPRVVWVGVGHDPKLELLHHDVERTCHALGYDLDGRAFRPHITLGRVRDRLAPPVANALARAARRVSYAAAAEVGSVDIMASELEPSGARYTMLATLPLGGN
jgi:2'-5' RNA ligase